MCVCVCVRACVRACVCVSVCTLRACLRVCVETVSMCAHIVGASFSMNQAASTADVQYVP